MDIPIGAKVNCSDGQFGSVTRAILMPSSEKITHLVVASSSFPTTEYLVSIEFLAETTPKLVRLNCTRKQLSAMQVFSESIFIRSNLMGFTGTPYLMWPYFVPDLDFIELDKEHIPAKELTFGRGARVEATDGPVGHVDEFLINPKTGHITHLVLREGHLWGQKDVTIPVSQIDHYAENTVYLNLDKHGVETLPTIPVRRSGGENKSSVN